MPRELTKADIEDFQRYWEDLTGIKIRDKAKETLRPSRPSLITVLSNLFKEILTPPKRELTKADIEAFQKYWEDLTGIKVKDKVRDTSRPAPTTVPPTSPEKRRLTGIDWGRVIPPMTVLPKGIPIRPKEEKAIREKPEPTPRVEAGKPALKVEPKRPVRKVEVKKAETPEKATLTDLERIKEMVEPEKKAIIAEVQKNKELFENIQEGLKTKSEEYKKIVSESDEILKKGLDELKEISKKISDELTKPIPKPPTEEEITRPKNKILALLKDLTPIIIGITALLRPGRYGENLTYFNSMYDATKALDKEKYTRALERWKLETEIGLAERENMIKALELTRDDIKLRTDISLKTKQNALKILEIEMNSLDRQLETAKDMYKESLKALDNIDKKILDYAKYYNDIRKLEEEIRHHRAMETVARERAGKEPSAIEVYEWYLRQPPEIQEKILEYKKTGTYIPSTELEELLTGKGGITPQGGERERLKKMREAIKQGRTP